MQSPAPWSAADVGVIVLAGGRASRFGGNKLHAARDGETLLHRVLVQCVELTPTVVAVGPPAHREIPVTWTRERPTGAGPVAALLAGLEVLANRDGVPPITVVLAGDAPNGPTAAPALVGALAERPHADAVVLVDQTGRAQPLCAGYRTSALREALAVVHTTRESSTADGRSAHGMRNLLEHLSLVELPDAWGAAEDIDTREDAQRLGYTAEQ